MTMRGCNDIKGGFAAVLGRDSPCSMAPPMKHGQSQPGQARPVLMLPILVQKGVVKLVRLWESSPFAHYSAETLPSHCLGLSQAVHPCRKLDH